MSVDCSTSVEIVNWFKVSAGYRRHSKLLLSPFLVPLRPKYYNNNRPEL